MQYFKLQFWEFLAQKLKQKQTVVLLLVPQSIGSSPGKVGHKMIVSSDGTMFGTIGGGAMEYRLIEQRKKDLVAQYQGVLYDNLVHDPQQKNKGNWSGLACSGQQTILSYFLDIKELSLIQNIVASCRSGQADFLRATPQGLELQLAENNAPVQQWQCQSPQEWQYKFRVGFRAKLYIVGAGHVGLALCQQMALLDFNIIILDNRPQLDSSDFDDFVDQKIIVKYQNIGNFVPSTLHDYIVIMTFSAALDSLVLQQLLLKKCRYIGLMASTTKAERIRQELLKKGFSESEYNRLHSPIGLAMPCLSPAEIAVSIAAQIIATKNDKRPTSTPT